MMPEKDLRGSVAGYGLNRQRLCMPTHYILRTIANSWREEASQAMTTVTQ